MHRQIAGSLTGPATKWIVFGVTILFAGVMMSLGSGMGDVKNNEASSWLPGSSESAKVADQLSQNVDPNDIPTLVIYERKGGLTTADLAAIDEQAAEIGEIDGVTGDGVLTPNAATALAESGEKVPPLLSDDGEVAYSYLVLNYGKAGWEKVPDATDKISDIAKIDGVEVYVGGFGGQAADFSKSFEESQVVLLMATFIVVILILLFTYRSPILWLLPIISVVVSIFVTTGVVYLLAKYTDLTVNDQTLYIMDILVIGAGHRLRAAAGRPISRGAPPPREPPRGDGVRAAPRGSGHHRQRRDGDRGSALPACSPTSTRPRAWDPHWPSRSAARCS